MTIYTGRQAWAQYRPGDLVDPYDIPEEIIERWVQTTVGGPGYNTRRACYCWGYRPAHRPPTLDGVKWSNQLTPWRICPENCPCPPPLVPPPCPSCPGCPTCPEIPVLEPTTCPPIAQTVESRSSSWIWFAAAAAAVVGVYGVRRTIQLRR